MKAKKFFLLLIVSSVILSATEQKGLPELERELQEFIKKPIKDPRDDILKQLFDPTAEQLEQVQKLLENPELDSEVRAWVIFAISKMPILKSEVMLPLLYSALKNPSWRVRKNAANTLSSLMFPQSTFPLLEALCDSEVLVRNSIEYALERVIQLDEEKRVAKVFSDLDEDGRNRFIRVLGKLDEPKAIPFFLKAWEDSSPQVRATALYYLCQNAPHQVLTLIEQLKKEKSSEVKFIAAQMLKEIDFPEKNELLSKWLKDSDEKVCLAAANSLQSPEILWNFIEKRKSFPMDRVFATAIASACRSQDPKAFSLAQKILEKEEVVDYHKAIILNSLAEYNQAEAFFVLAEHLKSPSDFLRNISLASLIYASERNSLSPPEEKSYQAWQDWYQLHKEAILAQKNLKHSSFQNKHRKSSNYVLKANVGNLFIDNVLVTMEYLNQYYHGIFSARPIAETLSESEMLAASQLEKEKRTIFAHGEGYFFKESGVTVVFENNKDNNKRIIQYPYNKTVWLTPGRVKKIKTPEGKIITQQDGYALGKETTIRVFRKRRGFQKYASNNEGQWAFLKDAGAYYSPMRAEIVTYATSDPDFVIRTLFHETLHQVLTQYIFTCPIWFNEGMAEYADSFTWNDGGYQIGLLDPKHLYLVKKIIQEEKYTKIENLLQLDHFSFHNDNFGPHEISHYSLSWSLIYFLKNGYNGKYQKCIDEYILALQDGEDPFLSFKRILEEHDLDLAELEKIWRYYYLNLEFPPK